MGCCIIMVAPDSLTDSSVERNTSQGDVINGTDQQVTAVSNGNENPKTEISVVNEGATTKQPSYVALACCISGYTTLSYDSKQRQGLRSRPVSPIRGDSFNKNATYTSECGNYLSPVARDLTPKMQAQDKVSGVEIMNGCGSLHSPRHVSSMSMSQESRTYTSKSMFVSESFSSFSSSSSTTCYSVSTSHNSSTTLNGNESRIGTFSKLPRSGSEDQTGATSPSSFIMQRVERLYGPGALAQGFYTRRTSTSTITSRKTVEHNKDMKTSYSVDEMNSVKNEESSLPVFKLLRPEFRAQLSLASRKSRTIPIEQAQESKMEGLIKTPEQEEKLMGGDEIDATVQSRNCGDLKPEIKNGHYFLKLLEEQVNTLESLASSTEEELKTCTSEEGCGILRAAAGKARLLVAQKLKQFSGLCQNNIKQSSTEDFPTTNEDLAGFWDMVMIQVRDVITQFDNIKTLRANNWRSPKSEGDKATTNGCSKGGSTSTGAGRRTVLKRASNTDPKVSAASKARDEARKKMLEERRKAMRENKMNNDVLIIS